MNVLFFLKMEEAKDNYILMTCLTACTEVPTASLAFRVSQGRRDDASVDYLCLSCSSLERKKIVRRK